MAEPACSSSRLRRPARHERSAAGAGRSADGWDGPRHHHLEHERKRSLYGEIFELLEPGGVFANFEHVASATQRLHLMFFAAINEPLEHEDPSDRLLAVETQLGYLREHGFDDVDCYWKWLEMALLVGVKPA